MAGIIEPSAQRVVVFDLDEALLDRREAWRFAIEEAVASATRERVSARALVEEYRLRPFRDAIRVLLPDPDAQDRCEKLARAMWGRSAMKRLLVHDGIGMALDTLREARIEIGAITMEPHSTAIKQLQSTGLDRFVTVLSATPAHGGWDPISRWEDCLRFVEQPASRAVFVSPSVDDLRAVASTGATTIGAGWSRTFVEGALGHPGELLPFIRAVSSRTA